MHLILALTALVWTETTQSDFNDGSEWHEYAPGSWADGGLGSDLYVPLVDEDGRVGQVGQDWDFDDNGSYDIVYGDYTGGQIRFVWGPSWTNTFVGGGGTRTAIVTGDFSNDGFPDVMGENYGTGTSQIYTGTGTQTFNPGPTIAKAGDGAGVGDLNNDGNLDVIICDATESRLYWGPAFSTYVSLPGMGSLSMDAWVGDFDRDGNVDFALAPWSPEVRVYWGPGFGSYTSLATSQNTQGTIGADFNQDGWLDIATGAGWAASGFVEIFWGSATGFTAGPTDMAGNGIGHAFATADLDNSGYLDLVSVFSYDQFARVYWDVGVNNLSTWNNYVTGLPTFITNVNIADYDGDDTLDMFISGDQNWGNIVWGPSFTANTTVTAFGWGDDGQEYDLGDRYARVDHARYVSNVFDNTEPCSSAPIDWRTWEHNPADTVAFLMRVGNTPVPDPSWTPWTTITAAGRVPDGVDKWWYSSTLPPAVSGYQYLQYGADLYSNGMSTAALRLVEIGCQPTGVGAEEGQNMPTKLTVDASVRKDGRLAFEYYLPYQTGWELKVYNLVGELVYSYNGQVSSGKGSHSVVLPSSGVYLYTFTDAKTSVRGKVSVVR